MSGKTTAVSLRLWIRIEEKHQKIHWKIIFIGLVSRQIFKGYILRLTLCTYIRHQNKKIKFMCACSSSAKRH